jgi:hypothetical protein
MPACRRLFLFALAATLIGSASGARAQAYGYSRAAAQVIAQAFDATGGRGWYQLRGWHEAGRLGDQAYERWIDPVRYGLRVETHEPGGLRIEGFNGQADWEVTPAGEMTAANNHSALAESRTEAFFEGALFLFPGRFGAKGDALGVRRRLGHAYKVVTVTPWNGRPRELWFDARTHLLARIVDRSGPQPRAIAVSDYRKVGPVRIAFRYAPEDGGPVRQLQAVSFAPSDRALFSLEREADWAKWVAARPKPGQAFQAP